MRRYCSEKSNEVKFFTGYEKLGLHTYNKKILGVVGIQPFEEIVTKAIESECNFVLLGANKSFIPASIEDEEWYNLIEKILLSTRLSVILSMNMADTGLFDYARLKNQQNFHMQLYVTAVNINEYPGDTTVVFEDRLWEQNNRMLYSMPLSDVTKSENGVTWDSIANDAILEKQNNA